MKPFPTNTNPRKLTLDQMWELHRVLNTSQGANLQAIIENTHPLRIATAMDILYGDSNIVASGPQLLWYLMQGLYRNHFHEFLKTIGKE